WSLAGFIWAAVRFEPWGPVPQLVGLRARPLRTVPRIASAPRRRPRAPTVQSRSSHELGQRLLLWQGDCQGRWRRCVAARDVSIAIGASGEIDVGTPRRLGETTRPARRDW